LPRPTDSGDVLFRTAWRLFQAVHGGRKVRLVGISSSGFTSGPQLDLFPQQTSRADRLRDVVAERFGEDALTRASLLGRRERRHPESISANETTATARARRRG
jgi:DNA polymerase-4